MDTRKPSVNPEATALDSIAEEALQTFDEGVDGKTVYPDDAGSDDARSIWNGVIDRYPPVVARCTDGANVARAISFASEHALPIVIRGGGHNVAGSAVCDGGVTN